jgi:RHS repeat-associated protein
MDGWNVISEFSLSQRLPLSKSPSLRLVWGEDISGTLQGAGGIGGLLSSVMPPSTMDLKPSTNHFLYDSNGNVIRLTDEQGKESACYCYDAFGKTTLVQGPSAESNRYRFSTKPVENGGGLAYYGFRYYSPKSGRWLSHDPLWQPKLNDTAVVAARRSSLANTNPGAQEYEFTRNSAINSVDIIGLSDLFPYGTNAVTKCCSGARKVLNGPLGQAGAVVNVFSAAWKEQDCLDAVTARAQECMNNAVNNSTSWEEANNTIDACQSDAESGVLGCFLESISRASGFKDVYDNCSEITNSWFGNT